MLAVEKRHSFENLSPFLPPPRRRYGLLACRYAAAMVVATTAAVTLFLPFSASAQSLTSPAKPAPKTTSVSFDTLAAKADTFLVGQMRGGKTTGWVSLIVRFTATPTDSQKDAIRGLNGDIYRDLPIIKSVAVRVPRRNVRTLAAQSYVARLSTDTSVQKNDEFTVESSGADTAFAQYSATGEGVGVAVVDSGVANHFDLLNDTYTKTRIVARKNFVSNEFTTDDKCGHGTHVAGIIAGNGNASTGQLFTRTFYGIARKANIISLRVLSSDGRGSVSNVIAAIQWAVANRTTHNIRVMNISLGHPVGESYKTDPLCQAVEYAWKNGIVVVCAAGNAGRLSHTATAGRDNNGFGKAYGTIQSPANSPYVITVGATKNVDNVPSHDEIASYSSRGPTRLDYVMKPDIVAPGNRVVSLYTSSTALFQYSSLNGFGLPLSDYTIIPWSNFSPSYFRLSGTSMAAPVVTGAVALMLQKNPSLTPSSVKARLMLSANKNRAEEDKWDSFTLGAGYLNIPGALENTAIATKTAFSPTARLQSDGSVWLDGSQILMASGDGVWGISVVNPTQVIWGGGGDVPAVTDLLEPALSLLEPVAPPSLLSALEDEGSWGVFWSKVDLSYTVLFGED